MIQSISQSERLDILLLLALVFERQLKKPSEIFTGHGAEEIVEKSFAGLVSEDLEVLRSRAALFDRQPLENQELWQKLWLEKLRRRGHTLRLDEQVNPLQIAEVLRVEPKTVQVLILRNLPVEVSSPVASALGIDTSIVNIHSSQSGAGININDEIMAIIRNKFLSYFVSLEDIYELTELDRFSFSELKDFIRLLGVRETAAACRGIKSKETLVAFLNRFEEENVKQIAGYMVDLEDINPFWVAQADILVQQTWNIESKPDALLTDLGLKILAFAYLNRDEAARRYTAQKLSVPESKRWIEFVDKGEEKNSRASVEELENLNQRQKIVEQLAIEFRTRF